jgi:selenide,water dikinase
VGQEALAQVLRGLPEFKHPNLLIGSATSDDAAVFRIDESRALIQTLDFFTPIVDDPFLFGRIAAANALSDVYAMGGRPLTAMNIVAFPEEKLSLEAVNQILRGGAETIEKSGGHLVGGHTIDNPEPIYGLSVTGIVELDHYFSNAGAQPGDSLVLTKPLGTGIVTTAIKRGIAPPELAERTVESMARLNDVGARLAERGLLVAATDVTGFGLLGHLVSLCRASGTGATVSAGALPMLGEEVLGLIEQGCVPGGSKGNLCAADHFADWHPEIPPALRMVACDAQTSGGLLLCVPPATLDEVLAILDDHQTLSAANIGTITEAPDDGPTIRVEP